MFYVLWMRTTLEIDDELLLAAKSVAKSSNKSIGEVISEWGLQALQSKHSETSPRKKRNGVPLFDREGVQVRVSMDLIKKLQDEES